MNKYGSIVVMVALAALSLDSSHAARGGWKGHVGYASNLLLVGEYKEACRSVDQAYDIHERTYEDSDSPDRYKEWTRLFAARTMCRMILPNSRFITEHGIDEDSVVESLVAQVSKLTVVLHELTFGQYQDSTMRRLGGELKETAEKYLED